MQFEGEKITTKNMNVEKLVLKMNRLGRNKIHMVNSCIVVCEYSDSVTFLMCFMVSYKLCLRIGC